jgi:membrane protease YdiL (CAAX protease family)
MAGNNGTQQIKSSTGRNWITFSLILALLFLRLLVTAIRMLCSSEPGWVNSFFDVGTYLLIAILIVREDRSLDDYHINSFVIWLLILFKPIQTIYFSGFEWLKSPLSLAGMHNLFIWLIALFLLAWFRRRLFHKVAIQWQDLKWTLLGGLSGLSLLIVMVYPMSLQITQIPSGYQLYFGALWINGLVNIPYQIGYAAATEEPVFRGFLWGLLRKFGWRDGWTWLFQAGLFGLAHLYYLESMPFMFWIGVPIGGLVLGWLAWRSRSIAASMVAHGVMNGLLYAAALFLAAIRIQE